MRIGIPQPATNTTGKITLSSALAILSDVDGFFPLEWRQQAYDVLEKEGSEQQKELVATRVPRDEAKGQMTESLSQERLQISLL